MISIDIRKSNVCENNVRICAYVVFICACCGVSLDINRGSLVKVQWRKQSVLGDTCYQLFGNMGF